MIKGGASFIFLQPHKPVIDFLYLGNMLQQNVIVLLTSQLFVDPKLIEINIELLLLLLS